MHIASYIPIYKYLHCIIVYCLNVITIHVYSYYVCISIIANAVWLGYIIMNLVAMIYR